MPLFSEAIGQQLADYGDLRGKRQEKGFNLASQLERMKRITAEVDDEIARQTALEEAAQAGQLAPSMAAPEQASAAPSIPAAIQFAMKTEAPTVIQQNPVPGFSVPMPGTPAPKVPLLQGPLVQRSVSTSGMSEGGRNLAEQKMFGLLSKAPERELDRNRMLLDKMTRERPELLASMYDGDPEIANGYDNEITRLQNSVTAGDAAKERLYIAQLNTSQRAASSYMSAESARERVAASVKNADERLKLMKDIEGDKLDFKAKQEVAKNSIAQAQRALSLVRSQIPSENEVLMAGSPEKRAALEARRRYYTAKGDAISTDIGHLVSGLFSSDKKTEVLAYGGLLKIASLGDALIPPDPRMADPTFGEKAEDFFGTSPSLVAKQKELDRLQKDYEQKQAASTKTTVLPEQTDGPAAGKETRKKKVFIERTASKTDNSAIEAAVRAEYAKLGADEATIQTAIKKRIARARK